MLGGYYTILEGRTDDEEDETTGLGESVSFVWRSLVHLDTDSHIPL